MWIKQQNGNMVNIETGASVYLYSEEEEKVDVRFRMGDAIRYILFSGNHEQASKIMNTLWTNTRGVEL